MDYPAGTASSPSPSCNSGRRDCKMPDNGQKPSEEHGLEDENHSSDETIFVGGAQSHYTTLQKLAMDTLDLSWPNWRNYENPETYIIPPIFSYTNPEKSDEDCHDKKERLRHSEWAEHIVYKAICASAQKKRAAPILVVHSLDLDRIRHHLPHIFPNVPICQNDSFLREYDFVLIGPKIGLVVIEVKSSEFSGSSDFKTKHLPKGIEHGIKQLQYFAENFLNFLQECTGIKWPDEVPVRRILFMPNLERARHEEWLHHYQKSEPLKGSVDHAIKWYKEDLDNGIENDEEPKLLKTISNVLDEEPIEQISPLIYETYASIIAALGSVIVFKNQSAKKLDPLKLFQREAIIREASRIETQDPGGYLKKGKMKQETLTVRHVSQVILPTRQQLEALNGPNRQFIIGSAGTGKTVVLQEKAVQSLEKGLKVLIVAARSYFSRCKELFESKNLHRYEVRSLETMRIDFSCMGMDAAHNLFLEIYKNGEDPVETIYKNLKCGKDENSAGWRDLETRLDLWISDFDAILIDDAIDRVADFFGLDLDYRSDLILNNVTLMAYLELKFPEKTLWIALDPLIPDRDLEKLSYGFIRMVLGHVFENRCGGRWSCIILDRVMRSSENIYRVVYENNVRVRPELRPSIGHKVVGPEVTQIRDIYDTSGAWEMLWMRIKLELDGLLTQGIPLRHISIVLGLDKCRIPSLINKKQIMEDENYQQDGYSNGIGEALSINYWYEVSSLEWPIVIYASVYRSLTEEQFRFQRYRGCSRATTKLIEITAVYSPDSDQKCVEKRDVVVSSDSKTKKGAVRSWIHKQLGWLRFWKERKRHS